MQCRPNLPRAAQLLRIDAKAPRGSPRKGGARDAFATRPPLGLPSARASCRSREVFPVAQLRTSIRELGAPRRFRTLPEVSTLVKRRAKYKQLLETGKWN